MPDLVYVEWVSVIDERTTSVCLNVAGQVRRVGVPFDTPNGPYEAPPAHIGCRAVVVPSLSAEHWQDTVRRAKAELGRRAGRKPDKPGKPDPKKTTKRVSLKPRRRPNRTRRS